MGPGQVPLLPRLRAGPACRDSPIQSAVEETFDKYYIFPILRLV